jgi:hypothetical protein
MFAAGAAEAKRPPDAGSPPRHSHDGLDLSLPALPLPPFLPDLDFSGMELDLRDLGVDFSAMKKDLAALALAGPHRWDPEDEDEQDEENARDEESPREGDTGRDRDSGKARIYKMNPQGSIRLPRVHIGDEEGDFDEREATAQAKGKGSATLQVKGPVTFQIRAQAGEVEVVTTDRRQVSVTLSDAPVQDVALFAFGDRVEPSFRGRRTLRQGKLHVELPRGSRLDLASMSGDIKAQQIGDVRIRTMSGDVKLSSVAKADVQTISGDTRIDDAQGPVRLHTVSGRAVVSTSGAAPQLEFQSASGSLEWTGTCGKDCHLSAETVSGDLRLSVDPKSSFELSYTSHSGELRDELSLAVKRNPQRRHGMASGWLEASYGKGEGVIEADAFSGALVVKRR